MDETVELVAGSKTTYQVTIPLKVSKAERDQAGHALRVEFRTTEIFPLIEGEKPKQYLRKLVNHCDENTIRRIAEAAFRWPLDPPVGLVGAIVEAKIQVTFEVPHWPKDPKYMSYEFLQFLPVLEDLKDEDFEQS